jgi:hypothetical protein
METKNMNTHVLKAMSGTALALLTVASTAIAAAPTHGALYSGQGSRKKVALRVSPSGKTYLARLYCDQRGVGAIRGTIKHGAFSGRQSTHGTLLWSIKGTFASSDTATVRLRVGALCDGVGGHLTLTQSP